jgi:hypothetical protein
MLIDADVSNKKIYRNDLDKVFLSQTEEYYRNEYQLIANNQPGAFLV